MTASTVNPAAVASPPSSTVAEREQMGRWTVEVDGKQVVLVTADLAGQLCVTPVSGHTYRSYVTKLGAPGVQMVPNPVDPGGPRIVARDPVTGNQGYPEAEVVRWNREDRVGSAGWQRTQPTAQTLNHTELRAELLTAAAAGRLAVGEPPRRDRVGPTLLGGGALGPRAGQARAELEALGLLEGPPRGEAGEVRITELGREALTRWGVRHPSRRATR